MVEVGREGAIKLFRRQLPIDIALEQGRGFLGRFKSFHADACEGVFDFPCSLLSRSVRSNDSHPNGHRLSLAGSSILTFADSYD
jgi:hypothetical protein